MPYSDTGRYFWSDTPRPDAIGDLSLPPEVVAPLAAVGLSADGENNIDQRGFIYLGDGSAGEHIFAHLFKVDVAGTYHYEIELVTWAEGWTVHPSISLPAEHYYYTFRVLQVGSSRWLAMAGVDQTSAAFVQVFRLDLAPLGLTAMPPFLVYEGGSVLGTSYNPHIVVGRSDDELVVLHEVENQGENYLAYRAFKINPDGSHAALCPDTPLPGPLGDTANKPTVYPEFAFEELDRAQGLYLVSAVASSLSLTQVRVYPLKFEAGYAATLGNLLTYPSRSTDRTTLHAVHRLAPGLVALFYSSNLNFQGGWYVYAYDAAPSLSQVANYSTLLHDGQAAQGYNDSGGYEYYFFARLHHFAHFRFSDESPNRHVPMIYFTAGVPGTTAVGLLRLDLQQAVTDGSASFVRTLDLGLSAEFRAFIPVSPTRAVLLLWDNRAAIYEWGVGGEPPPEPVTPVSAPQEVLRGFTNRLDGFGRPRRLEGRDKLESTMGFIVLELLLQRGLLRQTLSETDRGGIAAQIQEALEDPANWWPEQLAPVSLSEVRITRRSVQAAGGVAAEGDPEGNLQIEIEYAEVTTGVVVPTETRTLVIPFGAYAQEE